MNRTMAVFETRRLRLLHELRLRGTITGAAAALSYSPSTVSQQLALLEREAGVPLLVPEGRRVRLTPQGETLADHAARVLDLEEEVRGALEAERATPTTVRVAVFQSAAHTILPRALTLLAARRPGLRVTSAEVPPEVGLTELTARTFDLAVAEEYPGSTREHRPGLDRVRIGGDRIRLALPADESASDLPALRERTWVMEPAGTASRAWATQQCRAAGFEPDVRFEAADLAAHIRLIASGHAVGLLPDLVWVDAPPSVRLHELAGSPHRDVFVATRQASTRRTGVAAVRDALRDAFADVTVDPVL